MGNGAQITSIGSNTYYATFPATGGTYTNFTISAWINPLDLNYYRGLVSANGVQDMIDFGGSTGSNAVWITSGAGVVASCGVSSVYNHWDMFTLVQSGTTVTLYRDGAPLAGCSGTNGGSFTPTTWYTAGWSTGDGQDEQPFNGGVDEFEISNSARSAAWINDSYNSQSSPSTFYAIGSEL
jgi:hypothetical protein